MAGRFRWHARQFYKMFKCCVGWGGWGGSDETKPNSKVSGDIYKHSKSVKQTTRKYIKKWEISVNGNNRNVRELCVYHGGHQGWCQHSAAEPLPPSSSSPGQNLHDRQKIHHRSPRHALSLPTQHRTSWKHWAFRFNSVNQNSDFPL